MIIFNIVRYMLLAIAWVAYLCIGIFCFSALLTKDIAKRSGKSTRKKWSHEPNLLRKYLFLDYRKHILLSHYIMLWIYIVSGVCTAVMNMYCYIFDAWNTAFRAFHDIAACVMSMTILIASFMVIGKK